MLDNILVTLLVMIICAAVIVSVITLIILVYRAIIDWRDECIFKRVTKLYRVGMHESGNIIRKAHCEKQYWKDLI